MKNRKAIEVYIANRNIDSIDLQKQMEMEQIAAQLAAISDQLARLGQKQTEHDQVLTYLNNKMVEPIPVHVEPIRENHRTLDLFRIPDPIKSIPSFDGNRKQISSWLKTAEHTLNLFIPLVTEQQFKVYIQAIINKIEGKAKDILCLAGNPETFQEVKEILLEALGDKQELPFYKSQLWANKQIDTMSIHTFYQKTKEILLNIKSLAKQNQLYNGSWQAICAFIEEDALAAFISGLRKPYFGYAQAAKPRNIEEAYAFLCKFTSNELISNNSKKSLIQTKSNSHPRYQEQLKPNFQPRYQEQPNIRKTPWPTQEKSEPTPMEIDPSMRSRRTHNRNLINNMEIPNNVNKDPDTEEKVTIEVANTENFWEDQNSDSED